MVCPKNLNHDPTTTTTTEATTTNDFYESIYDGKNGGLPLAPTKIQIFWVGLSHGSTMLLRGASFTILLCNCFAVCSKAVSAVSYGW